KIGEVMNSAVVAKDREAIQQLFRSKGYAADVGVADPEQMISRDGTLTIPIIIARVERIDITGNRKTKTNVIRREIRTKPGDPFNMQKIQRDLERIYNLDIFEEVGPLQTERGSEPGLVVIQLPVKEKKTGQVSLGVGYSSPQGVVGRIELAETNFRGRAEGINLLLELGGRAGRTSYEVGFFEPSIDNHRTSLSVSVFNKVVYRFANAAISGPVIPSGDNSDLFNEIRKGGQLSLTRPINDNTRAVVGLRSEDVRLNVSAQQQQNPNLPQFIRQEGRISTLSLRGIRDTRDILLDPARGMYASTSLDFGDADVQPNVRGNFTRASVDVRRYFSKGVRKKPTDKKTVIAGRVLAGTVTGTVPFSEQFFAGGAESIRGYLESRFWGKHLLLANLEYRKPIANAFQGVAFLDIGDAWGTNYTLPAAADPNQRFEQHGGFKPQVGAGLGVRVVTPIGPLRLDWGFGREGSRAHFSIGHVF
ncbi:MAG: BamA/TamA family outer membrane protein, partial [Armatimonadetes bacterium]|nr:BamA/TamA family outer membrane protein [Armatimonadota bacterium]